MKRRNNSVKVGDVLIVCIFLGLLVLSHSLILSASGNTYYVSPSGDDTDAGTESQPWQTIQKAADALVAGDTVYIKAGTYPERVIPQNSGSAGNYITYAAYANDTVTIDGSSVTLPSDWGGLFDISNKDYIIISGLKIINAGPNDNNVGILADNSSYITIEKNYTYYTVSSGIAVWNSDNIIIDGNEVVLACNDGEQECVTVAGTDTFEVKNNHVHDGGPGTIGGEGIDVKDGSSNGKIYRNHVHDLNRLGIYVDSWNKHTHDIDVYQNVVYNIAGNDGFTVAAESGGLLENINIYNNVAYDNGTCGISVSRNGGLLYQHPMKNIKIINNTFCNNGSGTWGGGIFVENPDAESVIIRNNLCSQNLSFQIAAESDVSSGILTVDHNLIDGYRGYTGEMYGSDYVEEFPRLVDPYGGDFHLQANSLAIDKGSSIDAPSDDYDGSSRPQMTGYDIGAFEYVPGGITTTTTPSGPTTTITPVTTTCPEGDECLLEEIYGGHSQETEILRSLRDNILDKTLEGRELIKLYYMWSPVVMRLMEKDEEFKGELKEMLDGFLILMEGEKE